MKNRLIALSMIAMGMLIGSCELEEIFAKGKGATSTICISDEECRACEGVPKGVGEHIAAFVQCFADDLEDRVIEIVYNVLEDNMDGIIQEYLERNPIEVTVPECEGGGDSGMASFPAVFYPGNPKELSGMWAPIDGIVEDTKMDLWMEVELEGSDEIMYTPLFKGYAQ